MYKKPTIRRELCRAPGFLTVPNKKRPQHPADATQTAQTAGPIKEYCCDNTEGSGASPDHKLSITHSMARTVAEYLRQRGGCRPDDLLNSGFSTDEVKRYWNMACALAEVRLTETT